MFDYTLPQLMLLTDARAEAQEMTQPSPPDTPRPERKGPPEVPEDIQRRINRMLFSGKGSVLLS